MENKKMTKRDYFNAILKVEEIKGNPSLVEFINHELDLLAKKNSSERKPNATQKANEGLKVEILECMEESRIYTIGEMLKEFPVCAELSNQKVSVILHQMKDEGTVKRIEEKKKVYFSKI